MAIPNISANQLTLWVALLVGLAMAVALGSAVGGADTRFVLGVLTMFPVAIFLARLKTQIWVLIPIGWSLPGKLPWLPLPFTLRDMCNMLVIFAFVIFLALRAVPWKRKLGTLDYLIFINLAYLLTVFVRNPVGFFAFGSSAVGGRPYFEIAAAFCVFMILSRVELTAGIARIFPWFSIVPTTLVALTETLARIVPQLSAPIAGLYTGIVGSSVFSAAQETGAEQVGQTRIVGMKDAGTNGVLALCARYNPITLLSPLHPLRVLLFAACLAAIFLSGFRSALLFTIAMFFLATVLRRKVRHLWIAGGGVALVLVALVSMQGNVIELPKTMQRTLSWLPGDWSEEALQDAEGSSQWRYEMWRWAWNDSRIMRDKVWGQGFGLSMDDMNIIASAMMAGSLAAQNAFIGGAAQEAFMITGSFHSGPISSVRYVGVVGLLLYIPLLLYLALAAWKTCSRAYQTSAFPLALFVGMPMIYEPFNFIFIFGGYEGSVAQTLFWAGLLNMTNAYIDRLESNVPAAVPSQASATGAENAA